MNKQALKEILMHYNLPKITSPLNSRLFNNIPITTLLKNKSDNNLLNYPSQLHPKKELSTSESKCSKARPLSCSPNNTIINQKKFIKINPILNLCKTNKNQKDSNYMKNNGNIRNIIKRQSNPFFFTSLKNNNKSNKSKYRIKSAFNKNDIYSKKNIEKLKKLNLFQIYKRSNFYNKIILDANDKRHYLNLSIKNTNDKDSYKHLCINNRKKRNIYNKISAFNNFKYFGKEKKLDISLNSLNSFRDNQKYRSIVVSYNSNNHNKLNSFLSPNNIKK